MGYVFDILPALLQGTGVTLQVFAMTLVLSMPLGLALSLLRISRFRALSGLVNGYI
jgi:polar amino acid transport system permease protein